MAFALIKNLSGLFFVMNIFDFSRKA